MNKKILLLALCGLLSVGCAQQPSSSQEPPISSSSQAEPSEPPIETPQPPAEAEQQPTDLVVADAAMYRGTVTGITTAQDGIVLTLQQPEGVNFGGASMKFFVSENTRLSFERELLVTGEFLEVYYGAPSTTDDEPSQAIAINRYFDEQAVNFNGTLMEYVPSTEKPGAGSMLIRDLSNGQVVWFNYNEETQFYLNVESLKEGDKLNIFHRGTFARSEPPQGYAKEVRIYWASNAYPTTGAAV